MCVCESVFVRIYLYIWEGRRSVCMCVSVCVGMYIYLCICFCVYVCMCMCVCVFADVEPSHRVEEEVEVVSCVWRAGRAGALTDHSAVMFDVDLSASSLGRIRAGLYISIYINTNTYT